MISGLFSLPLTSLADPSTEPARAAVGNGSNGHSERFFAGPENALVRTIASAIGSETPEYNPIVLCGPSGVGKTALSHALAAQRRDQLGLTNILVTTGSDFARSLAHAIDTESVADLRSRYQRCDLLLVDEVHRLVNKPAAQQFLLATIDALIRRGTLVLLTLPQLPQKTRGVWPTLASRLTGGLIVPLSPPGPLARRELILHWAARLHLSLSDEVVDRLAGECEPHSAIPTAAKLRHALLQLAAVAETNHRAIRASHVTRLLAEETPEAKSVFSQVNAAVARHTQIPVRELKGKSRQQSVADARGLAMYVARRLTGASYAEIGRHFGNRDHSTVLHACRKLKKRVAEDDAVHRMVEELTTQIAAGNSAG